MAAPVYGAGRVPAVTTASPGPQVWITPGAYAVAGAGVRTERAEVGTEWFDLAVLSQSVLFGHRRTS